jgi:dephospho-CoA kinase
LFPTTSAEAVTARLHTPISDGLRTGLKVLRARPRQAAEIAQLMSNGGSRIESQAVINAFGDKAFLLLQGDDGLKGLLGWKVENLVARVDEIHFSPGVSLTEHMPFLVSEVEEASKELQCEIALIYVPPTMAAYRDLWQKLGYEERLPSELTVSAWQEAAVESAKPGTVMLFKQLRADRVLRPI